MPREREELFRQSNTLEKEKIFILAFEGNITEAEYFAEFKDSVKFNNELIYLHLLNRDRSDTKSAPQHVFQKLKREAKDEFNFGENDELWMIIDTDRWKSIPDVIVECEKLGNMFVAVSNPCFEFWLLLHIKNINEYSRDELDSILENKKTTNAKNYVDTKITEVLGSFNKNNHKPELFIPEIDLAIRQAKVLDNLGEAYPSKLGSHIYKLMEKIKKD